MSGYIPFYIQTEIIKRVPVKSLVRFRSVSKSWKSLIDSSEFIARYRTRKIQPHTLHVRYVHKYDSSVKYVSVNDDTFTQQQDLTPYVSALNTQFSRLSLFGYSRGLFCFRARSVKQGLIVLWNPSIRRSVAILGFPHTHDFFGFAVCPVTNEPTIVKHVYPWKANIFTLSSKRWTVIQCNKPRECESILLHGGRQVVIGGCIYRIASITHEYRIVSFDLNAKEFKAIDLPVTMKNPMISRIRFIISKLKGSLVVVVPDEVGFTGIKVWKMEPDCSYIQLFTINTSCITNIVGFRKNGELVVETQETLGRYDFFRRNGGASALEVYDPCLKQITNLGMSGRNGSFFISSYKETLLLLDHSDSCEYPEIN